MMPYQENRLGLHDMNIKNRKNDQLEPFCRDVVSPVEKGRR